MVASSEPALAQPTAERGDASHSATGAAGRRQRKRGDEVRRKVLDAALENFGTFGFEGTSTRAVAARAGVTHTLVLYHFQSKENLWIATVRHSLDEYAQELTPIFRQADELGARQALAQFIEKFVRLSARNPYLHRILTSDGNQDTDRMRWVIDNYIRDHFTNVVRMIRKGQEEGSVRQCDPARLYYQIIGGGGTPYTLAMEYLATTGRDVFSEAEILRNIAFFHDIVFV